MKFIPNPAFERINSLLAGVDAMGCKATVRVEAFSCKKSKEEKKTQQLIMINSAGNQTNNSSHNNQSGGDLNNSGMGFPATSYTGSEEGGEDAGGNYTQDDRFLYLVSALNTIYGDDYDFSVLGPQHFNLVDPFEAMKEVDQLLTAVPEAIIGQNPHAEFWGTLNEQIVNSNANTGMSPMGGQQPQNTSSNNQMGAYQSPSPNLASECDFFKFVCPECDPAAQTKLWSHHYFIYAKKMRLMVSLLCYGEGNAYRGGGGEDGSGLVMGNGNGQWSAMNPTGSPTSFGAPNYNGTDSPCYYYEADNGGGGGGGGAFPSQPNGYGGGMGGIGSSGNLMAYGEAE